MDKPAYLLSVFERLGLESPLIGAYAEALRSGRMDPSEIDRCYGVVTGVMESLASEARADKAATVARMLAEMRSKERSERAGERPEKTIEAFS